MSVAMSEPALDKNASRKLLVAISAVLLLATLAAYWSIRNHDFVNYDDQDYLTQNPQVQQGLTWTGLRWAFTTGHAGNWHPLTWVSHMLDCQFYGMRAGGHHFTSLWIHATNSLLLFWVLLQMTAAVGRSAWVAALFALHPMHVESVAWASERKDVLSTLFFMLTLWAYVRYVRRREVPSRSSAAGGQGPAWVFYLVSVFMFACGLMSKPMLVTVPFVLLLLDYWPLQRFAPAAERKAWLKALWSLSLEKAPFFVLSLASSVVTFLLQRKTGTVAGMQSLPLDLRLENVLVSYVLYIVKLVWPTHLAPFYPFPAERPFALVLLAGLVLLTVSVAAVLWRRQRPYFAVGWFWYLGTLTPVIGLVQVGLQSMADRYSYIPSIGLFLVAAWSVADYSRAWPGRRLVTGAAAGLALGLCFALTIQQARRWKNSETLFRHTLKVTRDNAVAHHCLGCVLVEQNKVAEAAGHFAEAVRIRPTHDEARNNLGLALTIEGKIAEAIEQYRAVLAAHPGFAKTHFNLGCALEKQGQIDEALVCYGNAVRLEPAFCEARINYARALGESGRPDEAILQYSELLKLKPNDADVWYDLATLLKGKGQRDHAIAHYLTALRLAPQDAGIREQLGLTLAQQGDVTGALTNFNEVIQMRPDAQAYYNRGLALVMNGEAREAIANYRKAIELKPDWPAALNDLAWLLATQPQPELRNGTEAVRLAERACELTARKEPRFLGTLDAAYAEAGRFEEAQTTATQARDLARAARQEQIATAAEHRLKLYASRTPYRQSQ